MTPRVLKALLILNTLFVSIMLVMRLLPNDDNSIRSFLLPSVGCAAPCFMNVRAGITNSAEAARMITKHVWAQPLLFYMRSLNDMYERDVLWRWSGQQPAAINSQRQGKMRIYNNQAIGMVVDTTLPLGAVWLALGATDKGTLSLAESRLDTEMMLIIVYPAQGLLVRVIVPKRLSQDVLWRSLVEIESSNADTIAYFGKYQLPTLTRLRGMG